MRRQAADATRRAHPYPALAGREEFTRRLRAFDRVRLGVPSIEVDTTSGYRPGLAEVVAFAAAGAPGSGP